MMMKTASGFTLVEMLVVLSSVFVITFSSVFLFTQQRQLLETRLFLNQFQSDMFYAQQHAISRQKYINVFLKPEEFFYLVTDSGGNYLIKRHYSSQIKLIPGTLGYSFRYLANGNTDKFGSIYIQTGNKTYRLTFQIGKGRFYVKQE